MEETLYPIFRVRYMLGQTITAKRKRAAIMIITYTAEELQHIEDLKKGYEALIQKAEPGTERAALSLQLSEELTRYTDNCQRERFKDLEGKQED